MPFSQCYFSIIEILFILPIFQILEKYISIISVFLLVFLVLFSVKKIKINSKYVYSFFYNFYFSFSYFS